MHHRTAKTQMPVFRSEAKGHIFQNSAASQDYLANLSEQSVEILFWYSSAFPNFRSHPPSQPASEWSVMMEAKVFLVLFLLAHTWGETYLVNCWWVRTNPSKRMGNLTSQLPTMFCILKSRNFAGNPSFCTTRAYFLAASRDCSSLQIYNKH